MEPSTQTSSSSDYNDPAVATQAANLTKAIFQNESGTNYNATGDAGTSKGAGQWQAATWKAQAQDVLGDAGAPMTPANQSVVAQGTIRKLIAQGKNAAQIAAIWNSGTDTNWENKVGKTTINGQTISYNVPQYVKNVTDLYQQYKSQSPQPTPPQAKDPGFLANEGTSVANRLTQGSNAVANTFSGKIDPISGVLQTVGAAAGGINDLAGNALGAIVPGFIKKPVEGAVSGLIGNALNTKVGQSAISGVESFAQSHPTLSNDIGAVGNIVGAAGLVTGAGAAKDAVGSLISKGIGRDILGSTIEDISPTIKAGSTKGAAYAKGIGNSKNAFGNITRNIDPQLRQVATVVKEAVPKFDKLPTFTDKLNAVKDGVTKFAQQLRTNLRGNVQPILTNDDIQTLQNGIKAEIERNPMLTGDAGVNAQKIFNEFIRHLPTGKDATMEDVLDARQAVDSWIKTIGKGKAFDPSMENALSVGLRAVRQGANDLMESKVPDAGVKALLKKQTLLYDAMDGLAPKADSEVGTGVIKRFANSHPGLIRAGKYAGGTITTGLGIKEGQNLLGGSQ